LVRTVLGAAFALFVVAVPPAHATTRLLVQKRAVLATSGTTISVSFTKVVTAGNLLVAYVVWDGGGTAAVADNAGNTYASAVGPTDDPGATMRAQVFYAVNATGGATTVTATLANAIAARGTLYVHEYRGVTGPAPLDAAVATSGSTATIASPALASTVANELVFIAAASNGTSITRLSRPNKARQRKYGNMTGDALAAVPGPVTVTAQQKGTAWVLQVVAFKPFGGNPPPPSAYPLKVSANGRYLVDQNDTPFFMMGDSPQALMVNLSEVEADGFFADRQAAGFNLVWINLLCATYTGGRA